MATKDTGRQFNDLKKRTHDFREVIKLCPLFILIRLSALRDVERILQKGSLRADPTREERKESLLLPRGPKVYVKATERQITLSFIF